jgi:polyferredoxin
LLLLCTGMTLWTVSQRSLLMVDVLRDRGALLRETADGAIENSYTLKLMNLDEMTQESRSRSAACRGCKLSAPPVFLPIRAASGRFP